MVSSPSSNPPSGPSWSFRQCPAAGPNPYTQATELESVGASTPTPEVSHFRSTADSDGEASTRCRSGDRSAFPDSYGQLSSQTEPAAQQLTQLHGSHSSASYSWLSSTLFFSFSLGSGAAIPRETILPTDEWRLSSGPGTHKTASAAAFQCLASWRLSSPPRPGFRQLQYHWGLRRI